MIMLIIIVMIEISFIVITIVIIIITIIIPRRRFVWPSSSRGPPAAPLVKSGAGF